MKCKNEFINYNFKMKNKMRLTLFFKKIIS